MEYILFKAIKYLLSLIQHKFIYLSLHFFKYLSSNLFYDYGPILQEIEKLLIKIHL